MSIISLRCVSLCLCNKTDVVVQLHFSQVTSTQQLLARKLIIGTRTAAKASLEWNLECLAIGSPPCPTLVSSPAHFRPPFLMAAGSGLGTRLAQPTQHCHIRDSADGGQTEAPAAGEAEHGPWAVPGSVLLQPGGGGCELFDSGEL